MLLHNRDPNLTMQYNFKGEHKTGQKDVDKNANPEMKCQNKK